MATTEPRAIAVTKYFTKTPIPPLYTNENIMLTLGGVVAFGGLILGILVNISDISSSLCCIIPGFIGGAILAAIGALGRMNKKTQYKTGYEQAEPKPTDKQMDEWLEQDKRQIISDAVVKLGLVQEKVLNIHDPLLVVGPRSSTRFKIGQDRIIRFSAYEIVVIYLTDYHLGAYCSTTIRIKHRRQLEIPTRSSEQSG